MNHRSGKPRISMRLRHISIGIAVVAFLGTASASAQENAGSRIGGLLPPLNPSESGLRAVQTQLGLATAQTGCSGELTKAPQFIFVPGILGSKLTRIDSQSGRREVIWGISNRNKLLFDDEHLTYRPGQKIEAELLQKMEVMFKKPDIYGLFFKQLNLMASGDPNSVLVFPYDWRQDNRESARQLHNKLLEVWALSTCNRRVVFIAHSMGGLVLSYWYHKYYKPREGTDQAYNFQFDRALFLGTPHTGSPSAIRAFAKDYILVAKAGTFLGWLDARTLARSLNNSGASFPSLYQLLPSATHHPRAGQLQFVSQGTAIPLKLFVKNQWDQLGWTRRNLPQGMTQAEFDPLLQQYLLSAASFHKELDDWGPVEPAHYFFSTSYDTLLQVIGEMDGEDIDWKFDEKSQAGDGTVPEHIALNVRRQRNAYSSNNETRVDNRHADLPKSEDFFYKVLSIREDIIQSRNLGWARRVLRDNTVGQAFADNRTLLEITTDPDKWDNEEVRDIVAANLEIVGRLMSPSLDESQRPLAYYIAAREERNTQEKAMLYSLYLNSGQQPVNLAYAANNLGHVLQGDGDTERALKAYNLALEKVEALPQGKHRFELFGMALNNLGTLEFSRGNFFAADKNFLRATQEFQNNLASQNRIILYNRPSYYGILMGPEVKG